MSNFGGSDGVFVLFEPKTKTFLVINYWVEHDPLRREVVEPSSTNQRQEKKNRSKRSDSIMTEKLSHFGQRLSGFAESNCCCRCRRRRRRCCCCLLMAGAAGAALLLRWHRHMVQQESMKELPLSLLITCEIDPRC